MKKYIYNMVLFLILSGSIYGMGEVENANQSSIDRELLNFSQPLVLTKLGFRSPDLVLRMDIRSQDPQQFARTLYRCGLTQIQELSGDYKSKYGRDITMLFGAFFQFIPDEKKCEQFRVTLANFLSGKPDPYPHQRPRTSFVAYSTKTSLRSTDHHQPINDKVAPAEDFTSTKSPQGTSLTSFLTQNIEHILWTSSITGYIGLRIYRWLQKKPKDTDSLDKNTQAADVDKNYK